MLFKEDALFYAEKIRQKEVTCLELTKRAIENIEKFNPQLNSVSYLQKDYALEDARQKDEHLTELTPEQTKDLPPFYGVPILSKDSGQAQEGMPRWESSKLLEGNIEQNDSNFIKQVKEAGFVIVGRTNTPEFSIKACSDASFTGNVNHPLDSTKNPGGSTGGGAASLMSGLVPIVTASDGGGSIRIPSSYCGLIGLKPSRGKLPVGSSNYRPWQGASVDFLLTKSVRDCYYGLITLENPSVNFPFYLNKTRGKLEETRKLRIGYTPKSIFNNEVNQDAASAIQETTGILEELGHEVIEIDLDINGQDLARHYFVINCIENAKSMEEYSKLTGRKIKRNVEPTSYAIYHLGKNFTGVEMSKALEYWDKLNIHMVELYNKYNIDLILTPSTQTTALPHDEFESDKLTTFAMNNINLVPKKITDQLVDNIVIGMLSAVPFTQIANLTGQPAISLPIYNNKDNFPLGSQFIAPKGEDLLLIKLSYQLEQAGKLNIGKAYNL